MRLGQYSGELVATVVVVATRILTGPTSTSLRRWSRSFRGNGRRRDNQCSYPSTLSSGSFKKRFRSSASGAGGDRTHDLTDYESAALTC
jgi:hypothetical protein